MAEAIKLNKKLYPVIELMIKPTTDAHIKIVMTLVIFIPFWLLNHLVSIYLVGGFTPMTLTFEPFFTK